MEKLTMSKDPGATRESWSTGWWRATGLLVALCVLSVPAPASADTWLGVFVGQLFGGSIGNELPEAFENRSEVTYGFNVGGMGGGVFGGEFDFGYTPGLFGKDSAVETSRLITAQGSLLLGIPIGGQTGSGLRPYGVVGAGLISRRAGFGDVISDVSLDDFGYNVGFGLMGFIGDTFGLRGEYRYFRNFQKDDAGGLPIELGTFSFSRASGGVVFRF